MAEPYAPMMARRKLLGGTEETTRGTMATVSAALSGTVVSNIQCTTEDLFSGDRRPESLYDGDWDALTDNMVATLRFTQELRYNDAFVSLLTGAGWKANTGVYYPTSVHDDRKTWSFAVWEGGRRKNIRGAVARSCVLNITAKGIVTVDWEWVGACELTAGKWVVAEALPSQSPINTQPYRAEAMTLTVGGAAFPYISRMAINLGLSAEERQSVTTASGIAYMLVTGQFPTVEVDPEARLVADNDAWGAMFAGTTAALSAVLTDPSDNTLTIAAPRMQRRLMRTDARESKLTDPVTFRCNASSGNDQLTFAAVAGS